MKTLLPTLLGSAGLALVVLSSGCDSAPSRSPRTTQRVVLSAERPSPDVAAGVVTAVEIALPPGPAGSAGDVWEIASNNARVLEQMGPVKPQAPADAAAAPAASVSFYVLKPGKSVLRFVLVRPGEAEATPAASCAVTVRVSD